VLNRVTTAGGKAALMLAASALVMTPAIGLAAAQKGRPPAISLSFDRISTFTPASADPRLAAIFAGRQGSIADFKFTPAAPKGRPSQIRVAIRARGADAVRGRSADLASADAASAIGALTPASYNLGVAVGWRRFAITGEVGKSRSPSLALGGRETAVVGVNYSLKRFTGRVAASAERSDGSRIPALGDEKGYAVDVGGAYNLTRRIAVTGGVRYKIEQDRMSAVKDERRDSQAVYVGTAFKF